MKKLYFEMMKIFLLFTLVMSSIVYCGCEDPEQQLKGKLRKKIEDYHSGKEIKRLSTKFGFNAEISRIVLKKQNSLSFPYIATVYFKKAKVSTHMKGRLPTGGALPTTKKMVYTNKYKYSVSDDRWYPVR